MLRGATNEEKIYNYLYKEIDNKYGVCGLMGNLFAESGLKSNNLQNTGNKSLGMTDDEYTKAVDNGTYGNFVYDKKGFGIAQWTYWSRKKALQKYAKEQNASIGDLEMQLGFLVKELKSSYKKVWKVLCEAKNVKEASDIVLTGFEKPKNQSDSNKVKRACYGQGYYDRYSVEQIKYLSTPLDLPILSKGHEGKMVSLAQCILNHLGYNCKVDGRFGEETQEIVRKYQKDKGIGINGIVGKAVWASFFV